MAESTVTFRVDEELKAAFAEVAANQERMATRLAHESVRSSWRQQRAAQPASRPGRSDGDVGQRTGGSSPA